jgi:hypothetical protein
MEREEFVRLIGAGQNQADYLPVALLLRDGYAAVGHYNSLLNEKSERAFVLLNVRFVTLRESNSGVATQIADFNDFVETIVTDFTRNAEPGADAAAGGELPGKAMPLAAVMLEQVMVVYPVAHIGELMKRASQSRGSRVPTFLDFNNKSEILKLLRTRLW